MADVEVIPKEEAGKVNLKYAKRSHRHGRHAPQYFKEGQIIDCKFRIDKMIGGGGFGQIYRVTDERTKSVLAIKIEPEDHEPGRMILEQKVMLKLRGTPHIPQFYASGNFCGYNFIAMQILGKNLSELRKHQPKRRLSISTVSHVGLQSVTALKAVHDIGYIHRYMDLWFVKRQKKNLSLNLFQKMVHVTRDNAIQRIFCCIILQDVKPSNICIGLHPHRRTIYIVDFGMARQYRFDDGVVRKERYYAGFRGTVRYVSVTVHERRDQGPVDDFWSLFYSLVELIQGSLPWSAFVEPDEIAKFKKNVIFDEFGRLVPKEMETIMKHLSQLHYHQIPNYELLTTELNKMLPKNMPEDLQYDWETTQSDIN
ncbi:Protein kinase domain containing protein [Brugia malayi]|uniref:Bm6171, isoform e n=1 Tax=Brugia malayi TaxID=6279 RepID=A0A0K0JLZ4_BRUMA|nr:Protein kinase domain containing protein [Brugia malayi]CDP93806.1 Bm6171, isoform e [Brugia malayi]VIO97485.1 Protein kinase domain containing protein [Brugia malayi]